MKLRLIVSFLYLLASSYAINSKVPINIENHPKGRENGNSNFQIGVGIYDITGPAGNVGMMGYAMMDQSTEGIHFRLRARAFIVADPITQKRIIFVSTDSCMIFTSVKNKVVEKLQILYGNLYSQDNVLLSGTHTHAGPAGFSYYALYDLMTFGFLQKNFDTISNGIVQAIVSAHNSLSKGGNIYVNAGELLESNINRSPYAYTANPEAEKAKYKYDVDKLMTVLKLEDQNGIELGMLNWFSVHGTSMNNTNHFISGDNKGYASYLFEKYKNGNASLPGVGPFVAAFGQSNEGDVSPNTKGAFCNNGLPCETADSTCGGTSEGCHAYGPGEDDFQSTQIIGSNQFHKALDLYESANVLLSGPVDYIHTFVDMSKVNVDGKWTANGQPATTCPAAMGDSFAAGTTDGPGDFDFTQGTNSSSTNPYWNYIASFLASPTPQQIKCHAPKPILLDVGNINFPLPWVPEILPIQILRIGQLFIIGVPGEFTTMSGRRLRDTVRQTLEQYGAADNNSVVVIAGLSNAYSHYITTFEEYGYQRYEGASTLYGPHTLSAYQQEYSKLAQAIATGTPVPPGPTPPNLEGKTFTFPVPEIPDVAPLFGHFGDIYSDVKSSYKIGDLVQVIFYGADPNNDYRTNDSYLTVEIETVSGAWNVVKVDGDWETKFHWKRHNIAESLITITWDTSLDTEIGTYRIRTFGSSKDVFGTLTPFSGTSSTFTLS